VSYIIGLAKKVAKEDVKANLMPLLYFSVNINNINSIVLSSHNFEAHVTTQQRQEEIPIDS
jgi:hypothetical protein